MSTRLLVQQSRLIKPLLSTPRPFLTNLQHASFRPTTPFLSKKPLLFSIRSIRKNPDTIPIIAITLVGLSCALAWTIRLALTRDDVLYCRAWGMACDYVEVKKPKKPPIRKFVVYNQKYETPRCLIEGLREPTEEELQAIEDKKKPKKLTLWQYIKSFFFKIDDDEEDEASKGKKC